MKKHIIFVLAGIVLSSQLMVAMQPNNGKKVKMHALHKYVDYSYNLMIAIKNNNVSSVRDILEKIAADKNIDMDYFIDSYTYDPTNESGIQTTFLFEAAVHERNFDIVKLLHKYGASPYQKVCGYSGTVISQLRMQSDTASRNILKYFEPWDRDTTHSKKRNRESIFFRNHNKIQLRLPFSDDASN